jgi:hypothetical protein
MTDAAESTPIPDPWEGNRPDCRTFPASDKFPRLLRYVLRDHVRLHDEAGSEVRMPVLVDCAHTDDNIVQARGAHPGMPLIAVHMRHDAGRVLVALEMGVDGVISLTDPPEVWRECLCVVMGGGRWLGGPGLEVRLEHKNIAYDVARHDRHAGDVTVRTRLFVRHRVGDKFRG